MTITRMSPYRLMSDQQLVDAIGQLERQVRQLDYLREPAPAAVRAALVDSLDRARLEADRRRA